MKYLLFSIAFLSLIGCRGPLTVPAIRRLDPDSQAQIEKIWNNMLAKPDRLDRGLLLDVLLTFELHQTGIDRATYHAEKDYAGGVVLMDMSFDRKKPLDDWFFVELRDKQNNTLRKEHYSGDEILSHWDDLLGASFEIATTQPTTSPTTNSTTQPTTEPTEQELRQQWREIRLKQIMAATQPMRESP